MLQSVHTVLIGKVCPASYTTVDAMSNGDVALFDENRSLLKTAADAAAAASLYVGVKGKNGVEFSNEIQKTSHPSAVIGEYTAPVQEQVAITLTNAVITSGNRYVIRIVYKDFDVNNFQFTHTYEVYAATTTASDLATALKDKINAHKNRRVNASATGAVITLTAMEKDDNEGVDSLNEYSIVSMEVSAYETIPGALLANHPEAINGATIVKTAGNPGKGYWKQVRDAEVRNMGYKGHVFTGAYPAVEQTRKVVEDAQYDYAIIENDNLYLSNDNQYIKTTPLTTEVYCPGLEGSIVDNGIQSFIAGVDVTA